MVAMIFDTIALRAGASNTFHRIHTTKSVNYGVQSDKNKANYNGNTSQIFIEAAYPITLSDTQLEPFVNFEYAKTKTPPLTSKVDEQPYKPIRKL